MKRFEVHAQELYDLMCRPDREFVAFRHGESEKNRKRVHGGKGEPLSPRGIEETHHLAHNLNRHLTTSWSIAGGTSAHIKQTVQVIADMCRVPAHTTIQLNGIHLGQLAALSEEEMQELSPYAYQRLMRWSGGELPISQLQIPGQEAPDRFAARVSQALVAAWVEPGLAIVGSRSVLILLWNLVESHGVLDLETYHSSDWTHGEGLLVKARATERLTLA